MSILDVSNSISRAIYQSNDPVLVTLTRPFPSPHPESAHF